MIQVVILRLNSEKKTRREGVLNMNDSQKHWAGMFGGLRVPFDFRMIIIGFLAIIVFLTGNYIINIFAEEPYLLSRSIDCIFRSLGTTAHNFFHTV